MQCCSNNCNEIGNHEVTFKLIKKTGYCCNKHLREFRKLDIIDKVVMPISMITR